MFKSLQILGFRVDANEDDFEVLSQVIPYLASHFSH
jgi:hypothetical protein